MDPALLEKDNEIKKFFDRAKKSARRLWFTLLIALSTSMIISFLTRNEANAIAFATLLIITVTLRYWLGWVLGEVQPILENSTVLTVSRKTLEYTVVLAAAFVTGTLLDTVNGVPSGPKQLPENTGDSVANLIFKNPAALACIQQEREIYRAILVSLAREKWNRSPGGSK